MSIIDLIHYLDGDDATRALTSRDCLLRAKDDELFITCIGWSADTVAFWMSATLPPIMSW